MEKKLKICDTRKNEHTGVWDFDVCVVEREGNEEVRGPMATFSIDHYALENHNGGDIKRWLEETVKPHMFARHHKIRSNDHVATQLAGKEI